MDKAMEMLEQLANKMGVAVDYLWGVLIKHYQVSGIIFLIFCVISVVAIGLIIYYGPRIYKHYDEKYKELKRDRIENGNGYNGSRSISSFDEDHANEARINVIPIMIVLGVGFAIVFVVCVVCGIGRLMNPDYYALKEILTTIGGVV